MHNVGSHRFCFTISYRRQVASARGSKLQNCLPARNNCVHETDSHEIGCACKREPATIRPERATIDQSDLLVAAPSLACLRQTGSIDQSIPVDASGRVRRLANGRSRSGRRTLFHPDPDNSSECRRPEGRVDLSHETRSQRRCQCNHDRGQPASIGRSAARNRRHHVCRHALQPRRRPRFLDRPREVGLPYPGRRQRIDARRLLLARGRRFPAVDHLRHPPRQDVLNQRGYRPAQPRLRRERYGRPQDARGDEDRHGQELHLALSADHLQKPGHYRCRPRRRPRRQGWRRRSSGRHPRLGCKDRQARLDLPFRAPSRRARP